MNPFHLILFLTIAAVVLPLALTAHWSRSLHRRHSSRYNYSEIFKMLSRPGWEYTMLMRPPWADDIDADLWADIEPIQWWSVASNLLFVVVGAAVVLINEAIR